MRWEEHKNIRKETLLEYIVQYPSMACGHMLAGLVMMEDFGSSLHNSDDKHICSYMKWNQTEPTGYMWTYYEMHVSVADAG